MDKLLYERICAITLNRIFGFEPKISFNLFNNLGSASAVFDLDRNALDEIFGPYSRYPALLNESELEKSEREYEKITAMGCRFLALGEEDFPEMLRDCEDPPAGIYIRSESEPSEIFGDRRAISIVGTRDISPYGKEWCERIVQSISMSPSKPTIVSGLALGVDVTAHATALSCGLPTIGVIPTGIDDVYPPSHRTIARKIVSAPHSALITDFPTNSEAVKVNFLRRNRLIAALGDSTILIESKRHGGGLLTAGLAYSYGRGVFVLPGRMGDVRSEGCNNLLREKKAEAITSLESLPADLGLQFYSRRRKKDLMEILGMMYEGNEDLPLLKKIAGYIKGNSGTDQDEICAGLGMTFSEVSRCVSLMESDGIVATDVLGRCSILTKIA